MLLLFSGALGRRKERAALLMPQACTLDFHLKLAGNANHSFHFFLVSSKAVCGIRGYDLVKISMKGSQYATDARHGYKYSLIGKDKDQERLGKRKHATTLIILVALTGVFATLISGGFVGSSPIRCRSLANIYRLYARSSTNLEASEHFEISQHLGQYSPYFSVPSAISTDIPQDCQVTFVQVLSRHGSRDPTADKSRLYNATFQKLKANVKEFTGLYAFLAGYEYTLGADQLTAFGRQELLSSGIEFYERYADLTRNTVPFVRASGQKRVVESAEKWNEGYKIAKLDDHNANHNGDAYPNIDVEIPEGEGLNNTLSHDLCTAFESGPASLTGHDAMRKWALDFAPAIQSRLNTDMDGANLTIPEVIYLMDVCAFETVASPTAEVSEFCQLFSENEWRQYNYFDTLGKYYGYSHGNPLGPTQGVGFVNELIARLTSSEVQDHTSTNRTLDGSKAMFPLGKQLYADFSHDNDMMGIFAAFGFYEELPLLPNTTVVEAPDAHGFSAAWLCPFAARAYFEKMQCSGNDEELVRVLINGRVLPLTQCDGDEFGRCTLDAFIRSLSFASHGGYWDQCFP